MHSNHSSAGSNKVNSLGLLRGIAVLLVCLCHFGLPLHEGGFVYKIFSDYGKFGVHIFFVISGFVIPFSLYKTNYQLNDYFTFLWKRVLRLHPPYLIALIITLLVVAASNSVRHLPYPETVKTIFQSLFYIHAPADNPVFWTLAIEAEFYIFIGLYFILLRKYPKVAFVLVLLMLLPNVNSALGLYIWLFGYLQYFMVGTIGYLLFTKQRNFNLNLVTLFLLIVYLFWMQVELPAAIVSVFTIAFILLYKKELPFVFNWLGEISYSLYLIHFVLGVKLINLLVRYFNPSYYFVLLLIALIFVIGIAWLGYYFIESKFANLSGSVKYSGGKKLLDKQNES